MLKNLSANQGVRAYVLKEEPLRLINRYLCIWNDKNLNSCGTSVISQLTACCRHLAV